MNSLIKPLGFLVLIVLLLSGLTSISTNSPGLAPEPTSDTPENDYSEWDNSTPTTSEFNISVKEGDNEEPVIRKSSGDSKPNEVVEVEPVMPVANFTAVPRSGVAPLNVTFKDLSSNAIEFSWDVDGVVGEDYNVSELFHNYDEAGTYNISLTVKNGDGNDTKTFVDYIIVILSEPEPVRTVEVMPVADFIANVTKGTAPLAVKFTDNSSNATNISWDVDGVVGEDSNASEFVYVYENVGTYNVSLTATNENGTDTKFMAEHVEVDSPEKTQEIPEFPTIAIPVLSILGFMFLLQRRK
ncbi:PKD domain-containing protein [Methanococcoides sp. NM1]|uniref:PKD domain-containing protein n=1 Tax=Methanococcoides sp. NM1 TaxID=1201013 RepID=UPI001083D970|nr:PKD domain-containing protein [Methanococcoides sp. NM1]